MKKALYLFVALAVMASCGSKTPNYAELQKEYESLTEYFNEIYADTTTTEDQKMAKASERIFEMYKAHAEDSLGLDMFVTYITNFCEPAEAIALYEEAPAFIKDNAKVKAKVDAMHNMEATAVGKPYVNIEGPNALTGETVSIASVLAEGKPVLVDFWASWCNPCRNEIKNHLIEVAKAGKVNILGIAVWEDSQENTTNAMNELGITWPVAYCGGRENSPSVLYGVIGIPTLVLIDVDGTIIGRAHSIEDIPFFAE